VLSVVSCLVAVWLGHLAAASINHLKGALTMELPHDSSCFASSLASPTAGITSPLYEVIVLKARELHLRAPPVLGGAMGFGRSSRPPHEQNPCACRWTCRW